MKGTPKRSRLLGPMKEQSRTLLTKKEASEIRMDTNIIHRYLASTKAKLDAESENERWEEWMENGASAESHTGKVCSRASKAKGLMKRD